MVEDKVLLGLTVRQCLYVLVGCSVSYAAWGQLRSGPQFVQVSLTVLTAGCALAFALLRPGGRPVEEWLAAALLFCASPRQARWIIDEPRADDWRPASGMWEQLSPQALWMEDDDNSDQDPDSEDEYA
ncbi:MAG: hypothetical protein NVSMB2_21230 [Chloroflexota bacterium]